MALHIVLTKKSELNLNEKSVFPQVCIDVLQATYFYCILFEKKPALESFDYASGGSRPGVWGGSQIEGSQKCLHLLKYQRLSATIVVCHTKEPIFCRSKSGYFCWSNYAIFQGITTV